MEKKIDVGQTVAARFQTPTLFKIAADLNSMQIEALVSEADIGQVRKGQKVKFFVDAFFEEEFEGEVEIIRLEPKVEQSIVNYIVVINVDNKEEKLMPGMTAQATIITNSKDEAHLIPVAAVRFKPPKSVVSDKKILFEKNIPKKELSTIYSVNGDGQLSEYSIQTGISDGKFIEIIKGFEVGDRVVTGEINMQKKKKSSFGFSGR